MLLNTSKNIIRKEAEALMLLSKHIDNNLTKVLKVLKNIKGNIFLSGIGKSGHIARKIASTMTSTGSPAFFIHPSEASHGDIGLLKKKDIIIILSNSGKSEELLDLINYSNKKKISSVLITAQPDSKLSKISKYKIFIPKLDEVGNNQIAPTTSTTMMLALGDAIALTLSEAKKFTKTNFGEFHPGGNIGSKFLKVADIMHTNNNIPLAHENTSMKEVIIKISQKNFGCIGITNKNSKICGIITDGDLRRHMKAGLLEKKAKDIMSKKPKIILENNYVSDALKTIQRYKITSLFVIKNKTNMKPVGIIHLHDCMRFEK